MAAPEAAITGLKSPLRKKVMDSGFEVHHLSVFLVYHFIRTYAIFIRVNEIRVSQALVSCHNQDERAEFREGRSGFEAQANRLSNGPPGHERLDCDTIVGSTDYVTIEILGIVQLVMAPRADSDPTQVSSRYSYGRLFCPVVDRNVRPVVLILVGAYEHLYARGLAGQPGVV